MHGRAGAACSHDLGSFGLETRRRRFQLTTRDGVQYISHCCFSFVHFTLLSSSLFSVNRNNMKLLLSSLVLAVTTASATLQVQLSHLDGTKIRASITNADIKGYNLLSQGSVLDPGPVRKLEVTDGCEWILITSSLAFDPNAFHSIQCPFPRHIEALMRQPNEPHPK